MTPTAIAVGGSLWSHRVQDGVSVWASGEARHAIVPSLADGPDEDARHARIAGFLQQFNGVFSIVAAEGDWIFAAADTVRSTPVAWTSTPDGPRFDHVAARLLPLLDSAKAIPCPAAATAIAMSGYTIGPSALFPAIRQVPPGGYILFQRGALVAERAYHTFAPWRAGGVTYNAPSARKALAELILAIVDEMMAGIDDRMLLVPLSAGNDSRLIVSAARHLGYRNIRTFAYGRTGNFEAQTSSLIAERLGYEWAFVPTDTAFMRRHFNSSEFHAYLSYADTLHNLPFIQDMPQIAALKAQGYVPDDGVFANGNSGDFISGGHISARVTPTALEAADDAARFEEVIDALVEKHFFLWRSLRTPSNLVRIKGQIRAFLAPLRDRSKGFETDYALYETSEFFDRQTKYVIAGQRIYEFLGHDWRLPLWDKRLLEFFDVIPFEGKQNQTLYASMLVEQNWGGVWADIPVNRKTIKPNWLRPIRTAAKLAHGFAGKAAWRDFERQYFQYWMENGGHSAIMPYRRAAMDRRGARNSIAWFAEFYLARHGLTLERLTDE